MMEHWKTSINSGIRGQIREKTPDFSQGLEAKKGKNSFSWILQHLTLQHWALQHINQLVSKVKMSSVYYKEIINNPNATIKCLSTVLKDYKKQFNHEITLSRFYASSCWNWFNFVKTKHITILGNLGLLILLNIFL